MIRGNGGGEEGGVGFELLAKARLFKGWEGGSGRVLISIWKVVGYPLPIEGL